MYDHLLEYVPIISIAFFPEKIQIFKFDEKRSRWDEIGLNIYVSDHMMMSNSLWGFDVIIREPKRSAANLGSPKIKSTDFPPPLQKKNHFSCFCWHFKTKDVMTKQD